MYNPGPKGPSTAANDPYIALATNIALQAVKDLRDKNALISLDALAWWIEDGHELIDTLGYDGELALERILKHGQI